LHKTNRGKKGAKNLLEIGGCHAEKKKCLKHKRRENKKKHRKDKGGLRC